MSGVEPGDPGAEHDLHEQHSASDRTEHHGADDGADNAHIFGTSFGAGLKLNIGAIRDLQLDYAYTGAQYFDALNTFAFKLDF